MRHVLIALSLLAAMAAPLRADTCTYSVDTVNYGYCSITISYTLDNDHCMIDFYAHSTFSSCELRNSRECDAANICTSSGGSISNTVEFLMYCPCGYQPFFSEIRLWHRKPTLYSSCMCEGDCAYDYDYRLKLYCI